MRNSLPTDPTRWGCAFLAPLCQARGDHRRLPTEERPMSAMKIVPRICCPRSVRVAPWNGRRPGARRPGCWWLLLIITWTACREPAVRECTDLFATEEYEVASSRCAEIFEESGDPRAGVTAAKACRALGRGEEVLAWTARLRDRPGEAIVLALAAEVHQQRGEPRIAGEMLEREIELHRASGDPALAAQALYRLFYLWWEMSDHRRALVAAQDTFEEAAAAEDRTMQRFAAEALFAALKNVGDVAGAESALDAAERLLGSADRPDRVRLLVNRAVIRLEQGRPALARDALLRARAEASDGDDRRSLRSLYLNLVEAELFLGMGDRAREHLEAAWRYAEPDDARPTSLLYYQGWVEHTRERYAAAAAALGEALSRETTPGWRWSLEYRLGLAEEARGDLAAAEEAYRRATEIVEQLRRSLGFDELKPSLLDRKREPFEALFRLQARSGRVAEALATIERAKARTLLEALARATSAANGQGPRTPAAAVERLETLAALLPTLSESPAVDLRPLDEVLAALGDRHLLIYFESRDRVWLLTVHGGKIRAWPAAEVAAVHRLVRRLVADPEDRSVAAHLGDLLLPEGALPPPPATLYLVADGELGRLPFAAVRRAGRYLVEDHPIVYVPSLNALVASEGRAADADGPPVVIGNPRGDLPAAALEARQVADRLAVPARVAELADWQQLRRAARARLLHLATHTGLDSRGPWLRLADGEVTAGTLVSEGIGPRLAVLAGCASGARRGKGMWGSLGAGFLAAGSRAVVAALWSVEDRATRDFVRRFYRQGGAVRPACALARTQRALIADGAPAEAWAPFVLFGSELRAPRGKGATSCRPQ